MGLVPLIIILLAVGAALYLLPHFPIDARVALLIRVGAFLILAIIILLFVVGVIETGEVPLR